MSRPLRVLLVEDSTADAELALIELRRSGYEASARRVDRAIDLERALADGGWELVLCDHGLPGFSSGEALSIVRRADAEVPVVILSGTIGEEAAIAALKAGAMDVVLKTNLGRLGLIVDRELREAAMRRDHRAAERALKESEARKTAMFDGALDAILAVDHEGLVIDLNPAAEAMFGLDRSQLAGRPVTEILPLTDLLTSVAAADPDTPALPQARHTRGKRIELSARRADGTRFPAEASVVYGRLSGLPFWTVVVRDLTQRRRAEEAARSAEHSYRMLFEGSPLAMLCYDEDSHAILEANDAAVDLYGYSHEEFQSLTISDLLTPEHPSPTLDGDTEDGPAGRTTTVRHVAKDGHKLEVAATVHAVSFAGRPARFVIAEDVGERERLARQLRQSQRLESLGQLAGGVAHDFNNLLAVIITCTRFVTDALAQAATDDPPRWEQSQRDLDQVEQAAQRAVRMTRQLLMFSRRKISHAAVIRVNDVMTDLQELLARTLGEHVQLAWDLGDDVSPVAIDPGQFEQVIVNLVVNARDAMPHGGRIMIDTRNVMLGTDGPGQPPGLAPGRYVRVRVGDTGEGMDEDTVDRAFEPFFTTKAEGTGTGLGLATLYGIVTQSAGHVRIQSEPGAGTTVSVMLPAAEQPAADASPRPAALTPAGGHETILLVEDQDVLRQVTARMLERNGYTVLAAGSGTEALKLAAHHPREIDLLLTDVLMPETLGPEVAASITAARPAIRVLYISGYAEPLLNRDGTLDPGVALLEKPVTEPALLAKVREVLDDTRRTSQLTQR